MTPVANFLVTPNLLTVNFTDISTGTPTQWLWDYGDGSSAGITQNPSHTYSIAGTYVVRLTVTNTDGTSSLQRTIIVSTVPVLPVTLLTFVNIKLQGLATLVTEDTKAAYIAQWQLFIQPLVNPEVDYLNVFNEAYYPPLANALIAYLAAYSIMVDTVAAGGTAAGGAGTGNNQGLVKKITTGPSEVEFQDLSSAQKTLFGEGGMVDELRKEICSLAFRLSIKLPMCPPLPDIKFIDLKAGRPSISLWSQFPTTVTISI